MTGGEPSIALCMIVKDEAQGLDRAISSAAPWVDQIVVVDTGSTDGTVELACKAGAEVHRFEFTDGVDLGAARTRSLELAHTDWALLLDGDTTLDESSGQYLKPAASRCSAPSRIIAGLWKNYTRSGDTTVDTYSRTMLPLAPGRRLVGRRHEYYMDSDGNPLPSTLVRQIIIHHWGFTEQNVNRKGSVEQNTELTLRQLEENPEYSVFWIDAIRANRYDTESSALALDLIEKYKRALENNEIPFVGNVAPFQIAFYESLIAFGLDRYEQAYDAAVAAIAIAPSRDMLTVRAAVHASRGRDEMARNDMVVAAAFESNPHPFTGLEESRQSSSKMLCLVAAAAERLDDDEHAFEWYKAGMSASPVYEKGPAAFARYLMRSGRPGDAASLLTQALDLMPTDKENADLLIRSWGDTPEEPMEPLMLKARERWPANSVFCAAHEPPPELDS